MPFRKFGGEFYYTKTNMGLMQDEDNIGLLE
jgi:hypothetical protein